jgi:hypothetical protein
MNNRPFILNQAVMEAIAQVKAYADVHVLSLIDLVKRMKHKVPIGDDHKRCVEIPLGHRVVYSIETQIVGRTHHLSMSVDEKDALPALPVVNLAMFAFGVGVSFIPDIEKEWAVISASLPLPKLEPAYLISIYIENCGPDCKAINVIAQLDKDRPPKEDNAHDQQPTLP